MPPTFPPTGKVLPILRVKSYVPMGLLWGLNKRYMKAQSRNSHTHNPPRPHQEAQFHGRRYSWWEPGEEVTIPLARWAHLSFTRSAEVDGDHTDSATTRFLTCQTVNKTWSMRLLQSSHHPSMSDGKAHAEPMATHPQKQVARCITTPTSEAWQSASQCIQPSTPLCCYLTPARQWPDSISRRRAQAI